MGSHSGFFKLAILQRKAARNFSQTGNARREVGEGAHPARRLWHTFMVADSKGISFRAGCPLAHSMAVSVLTLALESGAPVVTTRRLARSPPATMRAPTSNTIRRSPTPRPNEMRPTNQTAKAARPDRRGEAAEQTAWSMRFGASPAERALGDERGTGVSVAPSGDVVTTGWYQGDADFGGGPGSHRRGQQSDVRGALRGRRAAAIELQPRFRRSDSRSARDAARQGSRG